MVLQPHGFPIPNLSATFFLFGLGLNTSILLWSIAGYLLFRWIKTDRKNDSLIAWSLSFFIYSLTFVAHIFRALGYAAWNENSSVFHFFAFRWVMIIWAAGIFYGVLKILTDDKRLYLVPSVAIIIIGFLWFFLGLFIIPSENPIEFTMYLFLFTIWIPICFTMAYIFFYYGYNTRQSGPKVISLGFLILMISYMQWAPWHFSDVIYIYFIWYFVFSLSLVPILLGFVIMTLEEQ
ncbi:MAG: hypothetical protein EU544_04850 [Promethearchaeota archaeon]|nr:MAG: hypothetical protein EU544_04850 [Candidatus Lokiarchaeota archaeon]